MATHALLIEVRFHDGRYHGRDDWPPSPFRLFQALVAGAYGGRWMREPAEAKDAAFCWLERLDPPHVAAPRNNPGATVAYFVPNNDLDAKGGDPLRVSEIRVRKAITPRLFDRDSPILYAWPFDEGGERAIAIVGLAERLHTLGLGRDAAFARSRVMDWAQAEACLAEHGESIARPAGPAAQGLTCPMQGSLDSLKRRHSDAAKRFCREGKTTLYSNQRKARLRVIGYDCLPVSLLYELRDAKESKNFYRWPLSQITKLAETMRDGAAARLKTVLPEKAAEIGRCVIGRNATEADKASRIRITPLPSIGSAHVGRSIRRVLVEIPPNCPLRKDEIAWAFSGLDVIDSETGEILATLVPADDDRMLGHYGANGAFRRWRTVTPAALPVARRRIDPKRLRDPAEQKNGTERTIEEQCARVAASQALCHADVMTKAEILRIQREPFEARGARAESFAHGERFRKERLWHVEIEFAEAVRGPLVIGDGRYLGLGLMAPAPRVEGVMAFAIEGDTPADPILLARALRRAVMARVQATLGEGAPLPTFFSGHEINGAPARSGDHEHLAFVYDDARRRLLIIAPHVLERRSPSRDEKEKRLPLLEKAMTDFCELRAGALGLLRLARVAFDPATDPLFAPAREWENKTAYRVLRHRKLADAKAALTADIDDACRRLRLPRPEINAIRMNGGAGAGLSGGARLRFACAVHGPILIGRDRHFGGGLFVGRDGHTLY